jgi:hypothetical protein
MSKPMVMQAQIVSASTPNPGQQMVQLALFDSAGAAYPVGKQAAARADVGALTSAQISGGESPTQAEHNAVQTDLATLRTAFNDLLAKMRTAGQLAS